MPKGAVVLTQNHEVTRNHAFKGLDDTTGFDINTYCHFRNVQHEQKRKDLLKDDAVFNSSFLDEAANSVTKGVWTVVRGGTRSNVAVIRNHEWPGYTAFHKIRTRDHGAVYFGEGLKNTSLNFQF